MLPDALRRLRSGAPTDECFAVLDAQLRPRLAAYFRADPAARADADDLVQKTLTRVFQGVEQLREPESFLPWLFAIARNVRRTAAGLSRRESRAILCGLEQVADPPDPRPGAEDAWVGEERLRALDAAIAGLPPQQRQCLLLRVRSEMSYEEVAATLGISLHTVRNHLAQARRTLREQLGASGRGGDGT